MAGCQISGRFCYNRRGRPVRCQRLSCQFIRSDTSRPTMQCVGSASQTICRGEIGTTSRETQTLSTFVPWYACTVPYLSACFWKAGETSPRDVPMSRQNLTVIAPLAPITKVLLFSLKGDELIRLPACTRQSMVATARKPTASTPFHRSFQTNGHSGTHSCTIWCLFQKPIETVNHRGSKCCLRIQLGRVSIFYFCVGQLLRTEAAKSPSQATA